VPDDSALIFSSNLGYGVSVFKRFDEYTSALDGTNLVQHTNAFYNEHGQLAPSMDRLVRMTTGWSGVATQGTVRDDERGRLASVPDQPLQHARLRGEPAHDDDARSEDELFSRWIALHRL
jgi:hypothetical protein